MNSEPLAPTAAQRMLQARYGSSGPGMADVLDMATRVVRDRARRVVHRRPARPVFELLIVNDELADLAACLSDGSRRDATGRVVRS